MWFFIVIIAFIIVVLLMKQRKLNDRFSSLEARIEKLEKERLSGAGEAAVHDKATAEQPLRTTISSPVFRSESGQSNAPAPQPAIILSDATSSQEKRKAPERPNVAGQAGREEFHGNEVWDKIQKRFQENWTGIIGAVVLVIGVSFIGVYAALALKPFYRFAMIILFAIALFVVSIVLKRKYEWLNISTWIRSASGAIMLFACVGGGGWIDGLKWIADPAYAVALNCIGVAVNLYFGFLGGTQGFASLHVILSLVSLAIAPQSPTTFIISGFVTLVGIGFSYRDEWDRHLILTVIASLAYHLYWYGSMGFSGGKALPLTMKLTGISVICIIGIAACLLHYRRIYSSRAFSALPFTAHMTNWACLVIGLILYSTGSKWNTLVLLAGSCAIFGLAEQAKKNGIRWLHLTDRLVAQAIVLFALYTLGRWGFDAFFIMAAIYLEILLFAYVMIKEEDPVFKWLGVYLHLIIAALVTAFAFFGLATSPDTDVVRNSIILGSILCLHTAFHLYVKEKPLGSGPVSKAMGCEAEVTMSGALIGPITLAAYAYLYHYVWANYALAAVIVVLLHIRQKIQSDGLGTGLFVAIFGSATLSWIWMWNGIPEADVIILLYTIPLVLISLATIRWSYVESAKESLVWPGVYLFTAHIAYAGYILLNHVSPFLSGVSWLLLSVLYLEVATRIKGDSRPDNTAPIAVARHLLYGGYALIILFIIRHITVHMQSELYAGFIKIRFAIELLALIIFLYWTALRPSTQIEKEPGWYAIHPFFWELVLGMVVFTVALELPAKWHPLAWTLLAGLLLIIGSRFKERLSRFRFYALVLYWVGLFHLSVVSTTIRTPSLKWADQTWVAGVAAMVSQFIYGGCYHQWGRLNEITLPFGNSEELPSLRRMADRSSLWLFYPLIAAVALFLFWSFDRSILTLLWVSETFMVFVLAIILNENHFRYLSMIGLVCCLARLLFFDLSQSGTIMRAVVFIGVGLLMLAMNTLYAKYKERF